MFTQSSVPPIILFLSYSSMFEASIDSLFYFGLLTLLFLIIDIEKRRMVTRIRAHVQCSADRLI